MRDHFPATADSEYFYAEFAIDARARQRFIGRELRRWYESMLTERTPDELLELIARLERERPVQ
jgi:hypothetical protein